ncbi:MAG: Fis family transcriptional regulator [Deltaproteobacteria bacterium RBG_16_54_11]|jgi:two-component system response regulator PilR (NtrC family)|nr:MAG: Fis family transcriptional regulator [Deltaproteobacteria bacterium RBG_16_54_11]
MTKQKILVVDDEKSMCDFLEIMLHKEGYEVTSTTSGEQALELLDNNLYSMVLTDVKMPGVDGFEVLRKTKEVSPDTVVIMITAYGSPEGAVTAIKEGAYDYITKPFRVEEVKLTIKKSLERSSLIRENIRLRQVVEDRYKFWNLIGKSPKMQRVYELVEKVSQTKANVLITGESGTGKELVAKAVHFNSARKDRSFVTLNCGAIPENLLESELFGHMKGSFTGAIANKRGLLEMAENGTLFMDEVGELPLPLQVKLLRVIQEREFKRVGGIEDIKVDVRIISASNQDLQQRVAQGGFREDLFYRLNVIQIKIPPLRERKEDIPLLVNHFIRKYSAETGKEIEGVSPEALELLLGYSFPGNVRELENIIERSITLETSPMIADRHVRSYLNERMISKSMPPSLEIPEEGIDLNKVVEDLEKAFILKALEQTEGVKKKAAEILGMNFRAMRYKLAKYDL